VVLPERVVEIEYLNFSVQENDIYQALFKDGKTKFNHYCRAGTVLKHYASIFQLLLRYGDRLIQVNTSPICGILISELLNC
jgi:DNA repair protein RAD5